ncbi:PREDICTED: cysteine-rich repeat secretory protein 38-like [Populus euphratica]|uniref:Cysteine-rich repeat secretory protein 38-like n=1 Tax=Populus euphratica TaxID=75702 RepID=A0AAJ6TKL5_POPEU|nr:PREDICTED: cysteine-rich repeat secretory protein 38-like [Populus euphratica]
MQRFDSCDYDVNISREHIPFMISALRFPWTQSMELLISILFSTFLLLSSPCDADSNSDLGSQCTEVEYQANLSDLLNSLVANAPIQNGFYTTAAGKGANKIYGLTQCRGDISATDCAACIKNVTVVQGCSNSIGATLWFQWCLVRYSDRSFFGAFDQSGIMATYNDTNFEDAKVVSEGLNFTKTLASKTPNQPSMFYTAVLDVGQSGKRYGMAQYTRDLSKSNLLGIPTGDVLILAYRRESTLTQYFMWFGKSPTSTGETIALYRETLPSFPF